MDVNTTINSSHVKWTMGGERPDDPARVLPLSSVTVLTHALLVGFPEQRHNLQRGNLPFS